jgi:polysaccharide pyruvyl transferase WcaK-like protein
MRLIHLANLNSTNIGNGALISGTEQVLREDIPNIQIVQEAWDDYTFGIKKFDAQFVSKVNKTDGLLIGAAVTLNGQAYQKNTGTRLELPLPLWSEIKKPIIFYGISHRHWPRQPYRNLAQFRKTFQYINTSPNIILSVRNDGTKEWLEKMLGFPMNKIEVIPDPALFVVAQDNFHPELTQNKKNIILSLNNEDEKYRFGSQSRKRIVLQRIANALAEIEKSYPINIIMVPHYFDDFKAISEFIPLCPLKFPHQNIISAGMTRVQNTSYFYDLYKKADLALSMRIHSMSPAVGLGTPMLALTSQTRMTYFLKDAGISEYGVDIFNTRLENILTEKIKEILENPSRIRSKFERSKTEMRERIRGFNHNIRTFISVGK